MSKNTKPVYALVTDDVRKEIDRRRELGQPQFEVIGQAILATKSMVGPDGSIATRPIPPVRNPRSISQIHGNIAPAKKTAKKKSKAKPAKGRK